MKIYFDQIDLKKTRASWPEGVPFQPALVRDRARTNDKYSWLVLSQPLAPLEAPVLSSARRDEFIRIPVFPYIVSSPEADRALAFALQLGLCCAGHLPRAAQALHVVTGTPVDLLYDPDTDQDCGLRFWIGFAVALEAT